jgi:(p)ppGpp synthase/HD superfamily hydrolase
VRDSGWLGFGTLSAGVSRNMTPARTFALDAHAGQMYGDKPYSVHLDAVAGIVLQQFKSNATALVNMGAPGMEVAVSAAYLHDVVEDTAVTIEEVEAMYGPHIADAVLLCTDEPGKNRKERKAATYAKIAGLDRDRNGVVIGLVVKASDRLANLKAGVASGKDGLLSMYRKEHAAFKEAVYVAGLCDDLWAQIDAIVEAE